MTLGQEFKARAAEARARWAQARGASEREAAAERKDVDVGRHSKRKKTDRAVLVSQRSALPVNGAWPSSERARWLPALAIAIGIIYGADEDHTDLSSERSPPAE